jgi:hypothetical protein
MSESAKAKEVLAQAHRMAARPLAPDRLSVCVYAVTILLLLFQVIGMFAFDIL